MSYVDAGYTIALVVLVLYAASLLLRRRRLTRAAANAARAESSLDARHEDLEAP